jgi:hypothetical protein
MYGAQRDGEGMSAGIRSWIYPAIIVLLLLVIGAMTYAFIVAGSTQRTAEGRIAVLVEPGERALVLREMRAFIDGLQAMADALSREDMKGVAKAAREMGTARAHDVPLSLMGKLPLEFKSLAFAVHRGFDAIAVDAEGGGAARHALAQLSAVLQKCSACHATYEIKAGP